MQFKVPQFIEREAKIIGPLTFKQFLFVGAGGVIIFILYSSLAQTSVIAFLFLTLVIAAISLSFAFLKIEGHPLANVFLGFTNFISSPKVYLWERKKFIPRMAKKEKPQEAPKKEITESSEEIKLFKRSRLKDLSNQIEIRN